MRKAAYLWVIVPLGVVLSPSGAFAMHTRHHPWGHHAASSVETAEAPVTVAKATAADAPVHAAAREKAQNDNAGRKIAKQALAYRGTRYKFGGTSKKGLDCSGLVARIYDDLKMHRVPRVSSALYKSGEPVSIAALRPGDLVFFKNTYKHGISHTSVYAGNNKFVHAANKRHGVIVTSMADPYYQLHFAGARRLY